MRGLITAKSYMTLRPGARAALGRGRGGVIFIAYDRIELLDADIVPLFALCAPLRSSHKGFYGPILAQKRMVERRDYSAPQNV